VVKRGRTFPAAPHALRKSIQRVLALPDAMRLVLRHDHGPNGWEIRWATTAARERERNLQVSRPATKDEFVAMRGRRALLSVAPDSRSNGPERRISAVLPGCRVA
jgi:hypothetical protein